MNELRQYFDQNTGNLIYKWEHYFDIYDRYFSKYKDKDVNIVEIGVYQGGSLQMWKSYFGPKAKIIGVDINPNCKILEDEQIKILIGDQANKHFLESILEVMPRIDILIDDGGHTMEQQINTFETLYPRIHEQGVYLIEDLCTSYWYDYGGGYKKKGTFIEYSKNFIDSINAWHSKQPKKLGVSNFTTSTYSLHYYDGVLVIEKYPRKKPKDIKSGHMNISISSSKIEKKSFFVRKIKKLRRKLKKCFLLYG